MNPNQINNYCKNNRTNKHIMTRHQKQ